MLSQPCPVWISQLIYLISYLLWKAELRRYLLCLLSCLVLTHCAYYGDLHSSSQPLNMTELAKPTTYQPKNGPRQLGVWTRFKDPQLNQLICAALANSPTMANAKARVRDAEYLASGVASNLWPSLDFSGYLQRQRFSERGLAPPPFNGKTFSITTLALNFNYEFDFWGKNKSAFNAALGEQFAALADANQACLILSAAVANTYFQLLGVIEQTRLARENLQLNERILRITLDRNKHGIASAIPVKTIENNLQAAKLTFAQYQQIEALARHQLAVLVGKNPWTTNILTRPFKYQRTAIRLPACLPANLLAKRPDIHAAKYRAEAAAQQINVAKALFYPDFNLNALFSYQNVGLVKVFNPQNQNNAITGAVDLPIFDAGRRRANLGAKYAEYDIAVNDYNQTILTALGEVADLVSTLKSIDTQLSAQDLAVNASRQQYLLYRSRYDHGIADTAQLLENQQLLLQQQTLQRDLETRRSQAVVAMLKALGGSDIFKGKS